MRRRKSLFTAKIVGAMILGWASGLVSGAGSAHATPYGAEVTIFDGVESSSAKGIGIAREDNEAEPGMVQSQVWDLEGFFLAGRKLTIVGGYNFYQGQKDYSNNLMDAGDIFVDINGDAVYSPNIIPNYTYKPYALVSNSLFKYDYVLDINWMNGVFDLVKLNQNSVLQDTQYGAAYNKPSNPWLYSSGGTVIQSALSFETYGKASRGDTGFSGMGGNLQHYVATFDISAIDISNGALFHNTMECGNDNLLGRSAPEPVPEPSTLVLLGAGLVAASIIRRRAR